MTDKHQGNQRKWLLDLQRYRHAQTQFVQLNKLNNLQLVQPHAHCERAQRDPIQNAMSRAR